MKKYECPCGYVYDEQAGDPEHFVCPICGLTKDAFTEI